MDTDGFRALEAPDRVLELLELRLAIGVLRGRLDAFHKVDEQLRELQAVGALSSYEASEPPLQPPSEKKQCEAQPNVFIGSKRGGRHARGYSRWR